MDIKAELKSLIWDVNESQTDLIELGNNVLKQTGSFVSWVKCFVFHIKLPFKDLADRADSLVITFNNINYKLASFREDGYLSYLTDQDRQAFELLCEFASALSMTASILKNNQSKYYSASENEGKVSFKEVCERSKQYNESTLRYAKVADRLQPHIDRIFAENNS